MIVIDGVELGKCVTVRELMQRLGIAEESARKRLRRLVRRGLVERRWVGRVAVYCAKEGVEARLLPRPFGRPPGPVAETRRRMEEALDLVVREGCVTTSALVRKYGVSHTQAFHVLRLLLAEGRAVEVAVGAAALWCRDREAATKFIEELKGEVLRLVEQRRLRYVTPKRLFELITRDAKAREVFGRVINVRAPPSAAAFSVLTALLEAVYGKPISRSIYYTQQAAGNSVISIKDGDVGRCVAVRLTPDLAEALSALGDVDSLVLQAIEQLLARYRA